MKCTICGKRITTKEEICKACESGIKSKNETASVIISRHKQWAIKRLLQLDPRLDFLKNSVLKFEKEINKLEQQKFNLVEQIKSPNETQEEKE